jgi:hypothetical protein
VAAVADKAQVIVVKGWLMMTLGACASLVACLKRSVSLAHTTATLMRQFWVH